MKKKKGAPARRPSKPPQGGAKLPVKTRPAGQTSGTASPSAATRDVNATIRRLRRELAGAFRRIEELQASAETDFLLGIPNRRGFARELQRAIAYMTRYRARGAVLLLDVDRLKPINDAFGHAAGDQVLKEIVKTLTGQVRSSDVVARLGGDEFALLLWNLGESDAHAKAASLEAAIDRLSFVFGGYKVTTGASAGVAVLGPNAQADRVLDEADRAMYLRKAQRRRHASGESERS